MCADVCKVVRTTAVEWYVSNASAAHNNKGDSAMNNNIHIEVKACKSHGLEVFKVFVNGVYLTEFLSKEMAVTKVMRLKIKLAA